MSGTTHAAEYHRTFENQEAFWDEAAEGIRQTRNWTRAL